MTPPSNRVFFTFLISLVITTTSSTDIIETVLPKAYNPRTQLCCDGIVHDRGDDKTFSKTCCGKEVMNYTTDLCCDKKRFVIEKEKIPYYECCINTPYDVRKDLVCDNAGNLVPKARNITRTKNICGNATYDPKKQRCCSDPPFAGLISTSPIPGVIYLVLNVRSQADDCCGLELYDTQRELCCHDRRNGSDVVRKKYGIERCCGASKYNDSNQVCCKKSDRVLPKPPNKILALACCGDQVYDSTLETCCGDQLRSRSELKNSPVLKIGVSPHKYSLLFNSPHRCSSCGSELVWEPDFCCGGKKYSLTAGQYDGCCLNELTTWKDIYDTRNGTPFNSTTNICCGGKIYNKATIGDKMKCCGHEMFDEEKELCCPMVTARWVSELVKIPKIDKLTTKCCSPSLF